MMYDILVQYTTGDKIQAHQVILLAKENGEGI